jgi:UDP-glucose 4-epimerase
MRILITGGAGYIGSHAVQETLVQGHQVWVLDDLSKGHRQAVDARAALIVGGTGDFDLLVEIFSKHQIEAVMHFAASAEVGESVADPAKYYTNNFVHSLNLLNAMKKSAVRRLVFSSTAAVYGSPQGTPISESAPCHPINPYGRSKWMTELAIEDCAKVFGLGYTILRYFNVAGAHPDGHIGEDHRPESHLIPRVLATGLDAKAAVKIYGTDYPTPDGTCLRDYVHVMDLATAHVLALESTEPGTGHVFNLGSEKGFSVREVIKACESVVSSPLTIVEEARRPGDPPSLIANSARAREILKWQPRYPDILTMVRHAWKWHQSHPQGYVD